MTNQTTFYLLMVLVPFCVLPLWILGPIAMGIAVVLEIWFFVWFIDNKMYYVAVAS